ncbi:MAG: hypothetical protein KAH10_00015 [Flavobacteriales bacterium]|nr:hypothetical protein [Flavobacteriales bacterium]
MEFKFTYSSFPTFFAEVELKGNQLMFKEVYGSNAELVILSDQKIEEFWDRIKKIRLEYWKENYFSCVIDGLQWDLNIKSNFLTKEISGSNEFPDGSCNLKNTPIFDKLISAIEFLIDRDKFFENL